ncbi:MAG: PAS domain S-box protein [Magnetococcales bacterium]|nr:PAS domain S-box protein [Magnetococcales bacterium]
MEKFTHNSRAFSLLIVLAFVATTVSVVSIFIFYQLAFEQERQVLIEIVGIRNPFVQLPIIFLCIILLVAWILYKSITANRLAKQQSEQRFQAIANSTLDAIVCVNKAGQIIFWNYGADNIFGYSADEIINQPLLLLIPEAFRQTHLSAFAKILQTKQIQRQIIELYGLRKDGSEFPIELALSSWCEQDDIYFSAIIRDISLRRQREEKSTQQQREAHIYASIVTASRDMLALLDHQFIYRAINDAYLSAISSTKQAVIGQEVKEVLGTATYQTIRPKLELCLSGQVINFQQQRILPGIGTRYLDISYTPFKDSKGGIEGILVAMRDITHRKEMEDEQEKLQAQTIHSARLASLGEISASVAHEINNPNNAISFNASVLSRIWLDTARLLDEVEAEMGSFQLGGLSPRRAAKKVPELLEGISKSSQRITDIVANLKQMSRQDSGALTEAVNLSEVLQSARMILQNQITKHTNNFVVNLPEPIPLVWGNYQQLEQVLINIILNALQSLKTPQDQVAITGTYDMTNHEVCLMVNDQGCGIISTDLPLITEPFFTTRLMDGGTGLGLSISDTIIQNHSGRLQFDSQEDRGTMVSIILPVYHES